MQQRRSRVSLVVLCFLVGNLVCLADGAAQTPSPTPTPVLTLSKIGEGMGDILVDGVVVCPVGCRDTMVPFHEGDTLTIDALPSSGSVLEGWHINGIPVTPVNGSITVMPGDIVTAIFALAMPTSFASCELVGDVDEDGAITLIDVLLVLLFCRGFHIEIAEQCADVNCDENITREDAWLILQYVFGWIETFPCSSPPVADFMAAPVRGYAPLTVVFSNNSTGDISGYEWAFGDGESSSEPDPSHVYDMAGQYSVSLTASGPGGSDTLTKSEYIEAVLPPNQDPVVTITTPAEDAVVASGDIQVDGTVTDDGTVVSVLVNDVPATVVGDSFSATISVASGNQLLMVVAADDASAVGLAERLVRVDGEGPLIGIQSPKRGQAVYTLTPDIAISYSDFYADVDTASLSVQLVDENDVSTDVTGDLTITDEGAQGTLSTPLADDTRYTLTVSLADTLGNVSQSAATFYVPIDPANIVPPVEAGGDGWVSGVVYDSTTCNEHLQGCTPLPGARVTLTYAGSHFPGTGSGDPIAGTIVTGPEGFFAFPVAETNTYWLRAEKDGYTYAQREVEIVREHSTATDELYLTPIDANMTLCDETGCSHESSDGMLQVEIPAGAIPAGQTVEVTATNFRHVEFLPSGRLPEGTWETYAFDLGGEVAITFAQPITVKIHNYRGFDPGTEIPLGYWDQDRLAWEHAGVGTVDATGEWVEMHVTHCSPFDCNDPVAFPEKLYLQPTDLTGGGEPACSPPSGRCEPRECPAGVEKCVIDVNSGTLHEDDTLPGLPVLGQHVAPRLAYSSRRAAPSEVIDLEFTLDFSDPNLTFGEYVGVEVAIEGRKTDQFSLAASFQSGETYRYRYFWDGRNAQGRLMPPGVYQYRVTVTIPYRSQYYWTEGWLDGVFFGRLPSYAKGTGVFVDAATEMVIEGTVLLDSQPDSPVGAGWVLANQQRLYEDEAGQILISDGERSDAFYCSQKDLLVQHADQGLVVWANYGTTDQTIQVFPEQLMRNWLPEYAEAIMSLDVGDEAYTLTLSEDGTFAYVAAEGQGGETLPVVNLEVGAVDPIVVDYMPAGVALSPDGRWAYVAHWGSNAIAVVDLVQRQVVDTILLDNSTGWSDIAISADGASAYVVSRYYADDVVVVDLQARQEVARISAGSQPSDMVLSPDGTRAYVVNSGDETLSVLDLRTRQQVDTIPVGSSPQFLVLSPNGTRAYVTNSGGYSVSVVDLETRQEIDQIGVGYRPQGIVIAPDGAVAYVANRGRDTISVLDLNTHQEIAAIPTGSEPVGIALTTPATPQLFVRSATDRSRLTYDSQTHRYTRFYPNGTRVHFNPDGTHDYTLDRHGNKTAYTYNPDGTTATMTITPAGEATPRWTWTFSYQNGTLAEIADPAGRVMTFSIDGHNHLTAITSPTGTTRGFAYVSQGLMTHETDENGNTTEHVYDDYGRVSQVIEHLSDDTQEVTTLTTVDTGYPLLNDSPVGDPETPAPPAPTSEALVARIEDSQGSVSGHTDKWGRWLDETDETGTTTYQRDEAGRVLQKTYPDGSCEEYDYDHLGNKVFSSRMDATQCALPPGDRDPDQVESLWYTYETRFNQVKTKTDSSGNTITSIYDYEEGVGDVGNLIRIEYPEVEDDQGNPVIPTETYSYNAWGQVTSKTDPQGATTQYVYTQGTSDEADGGANPLFLPGVTPVPGLLRQITEDDGTLTRITAYTGFDAVGSHRQMQITDAAGTALELVTVEDYDDDGNRIRLTEAAGTVSERMTEYAYTNGNLTTITRHLEDASTLITEMLYDEDGNLIWKRDPSGRETLYTYQNNTLKTVHTDQGVWDYDYDSEDRLTTVTDPFGTTREREYDADGNVSVVKVNGDIVSTYTYDADGNLTQRTDALGQPYTFDYNDENQLIRQEDPEGAFTEYEYDEQGRLRITRDGSGNEIVREYEVVETSGFCPSCGYSPLDGGQGGVERLKRIIYPTFTKEFLYDDEGRVSEEIYHLSDTEQYTVSFEYDVFGRLESTTGPDQQTTTYFYDRLGRRVLVEDPSGQTQFEYDLWDNLVALTDAENQRTEFEYYPDDKLKLERRPMGEETTYEYDTQGRLWQVTDAKNQTTEYGYDAQSRIETLAHADGRTVTLSYDADGNLAGYSDGTTSATYTYDGVGRKLSETVDYGPFTKSFSYTYYGNGLKQTFTAPDGTVYTYNYGLNNELQEIQIPSVGSMTIPTYTWNRPATVNFPGGTQRSYTYDALMRLQSLTATDPEGTPLLNYQYTYDPVGNILTKNTEHGNYMYGYDAVSRLLTADNPVLDDESYTYDDVGNRLTSADVSGSWNYNLNNELLGYADVEYDYDDNGNLTEVRVGGSVVWMYVYDAADRLVHVEDGTGTISADYYYDPFGRRLWKDVGGIKTYFFYSDEGLIGEYDASGNEIKTYGYKPDSSWTTDPLFMKEGGVYYWYHNDHLGTPQKLVAQDGTVVWSAQYTAFGETVVDVETVINNLRFPGQFYDEETGLHYNYHRYYAPTTGRYVSVDPIGFEGGDVNWYGYAAHNPTKNDDPFGLLWTIQRRGQATALAVACGDTVDELASTIGLPAYRFRKWLTPADGFLLPASAYEKMNFRRFTIPNTIYAYWAGNFKGLGRWWMNWNASISYLEDLGFNVLEKRHERGDQGRMNTDMVDLLFQKHLHGVYFVGHGDGDGLSSENKWRTLLKIKGKRLISIPVGFVALGDSGDQVLNYDAIEQLTDRYYKLAFGLIFACYSNEGERPLVGSRSRNGVIWEGDDNWFWVTLERGQGPYYDPDADVPRPFHVKHWIRPGDQGTRQ